MSVESRGLGYIEYLVQRCWLHNVYTLHYILYTVCYTVSWVEIYTVGWIGIYDEVGCWAWGGDELGRLGRMKFWLGPLSPVGLRE